MANMRAKMASWCLCHTNVRTVPCISSKTSAGSHRHAHSRKCSVAHHPRPDQMCSSVDVLAHLASNMPRHLQQHLTRYRAWNLTLSRLQMQHQGAISFATSDQQPALWLTNILACPGLAQICAHASSRIGAPLCFGRPWPFYSKRKINRRSE